MSSNVNPSCCNGRTVLGVCAVTTVAAIPIVFLVLGILGVQGQLAMAPNGAEVMISLGVSFIVGIIGGVCKWLNK